MDDTKFMSKKELQQEVIMLRGKIKEYKYVIDMQKFIITSYGEFIDTISHKDYFGEPNMSSPIDTPRPNFAKKKG